MSELSETEISAETLRDDGLVAAILNYVAESSEKPVIYTYEPPAGTPHATGKTEPKPVVIRNARLESELSLDTKGFQLVRQSTAVHDFYDHAEVEKIYYPEVELLLKQTTGADKVVVFDHQVRNIQLSKPKFPA